MTSGRTCGSGDVPSPQDLWGGRGRDSADGTGRPTARGLHPARRRWPRPARVLQPDLFDRRPLVESFTTLSPPGAPNPRMLLWR